jgi:hypothetical protein
MLADRESQRVDTIQRLRGRGSGGYYVGPAEGSMPALILVSNPIASEELALLFSDGWIAIARLDPYRVDWRSTDGRWRRGAPLPFDVVRVADREKCWAFRRVAGRGRTCDASQIPGWPPTFPPFLPPPLQRLAPTLQAAPDRRLVIARTLTSASTHRRYDIVDRAGRLSAILNLEPNELLIGFGARSVYVLATDEDGVQTLRRHDWP